MADAIFFYERPKENINVAKQRPQDGYISYVDPQPLVRRFVYISQSAYGDDSWKQWAKSSFFLGGLPDGNIKVFLARDEQTLNRLTGTIWSYYSTQEQSIIVDLNTQNAKTLPAAEYRPSTPSSHDSWLSDFDAETPGYFWSGAGGKDQFWRTDSIDTDENGRLLLGLARGGDETPMMTKTYIITNSPGAHITTEGSVDASRSQIEIGDFFVKLREAAGQIEDESERAQAVELIDGMERTAGTKKFLDCYQRFMTTAANHATVFAPFLPALADLLR